MNTFNRIAMILILVGTILTTVSGIFALLFARTFLGAIFSNLSTRLGAGSSDPGLQQLLTEMIILALIVFVPSMVLLLLELWRPAPDSIRISKVSGSEARLSKQAVAQSLMYYIDALPGVVRVRPRLVTSTKAVDVRLDVETTPDVDVRAKTDEIMRTARNVVEQKLGLKLRRMHVQIHHATYARVAPQTAKREAVKPPEPAALSAPPSASAENKNPLSS